MTIFKKIYKKILIFLISFSFISISLTQEIQLDTSIPDNSYIKLRNIKTNRYLTTNPYYGKNPAIGLSLEKINQPGTQTYLVKKKPNTNGNYQLIGTVGAQSGALFVSPTAGYFDNTKSWNNSTTIQIYKKTGSNIYYLTNPSLNGKYIGVSDQISFPRDLTISSPNAEWEIIQVSRNPKQVRTTPVTPFNDGELVTIKSSDGLYLQMPTSPTTSTGVYQASFNQKSNRANQIFKIKKYATNNYYIIGTKNGDYTGNNSGLLSTGGIYTSRFEINKATPGAGNLFLLFSKGNNSFAFLNTKFKKFENKVSWALKDTNESFENLPATAIFTIEKHTPQPQPLVQATGQSESLVKLNPGYYKIKNVETNTYMTIKNQNLDPTVYGTQGRPWSIYSLRFENQNNNPEQVFKIEEYDSWHKIIGSIDATYQSPNSGMIDTGYGTAYFNKNLSFNTFRKIKITQKTGINGYYITSEKDRNNKYGVDANKLIKDKSNNRFIFEKTTAPTMQIKNPQPIVPFQNGKFVYIKDSATGKYMELTTEADYTSFEGRYGLKFGSTTLNKPTQVFKVMVSGNNIGFIGSVNNNYTGNNAGLLNPHWIGQNSHFYKNNYTLSDYRIFQLFQKGQHTYGIFNPKHQKFENASTNNKLIEINNQFNNLPQSAIFEIKEINQIQLEEQQPTPVTPFVNGEKVTIKSHSGKYYQMSSNTQGQFVYTAIMKPNQILTVKLNPDSSYSFIGTVNGNIGMLQSHPSYARFIINKTTPDKENKFYLYPKGNNSFALFSNNTYKTQYSWALSNINEPFNNLPESSIFTIEKYTPQPQPLVQATGQSESLVKLNPGYYKIKNVETNTYMTIKNQNLDPTVYGTQGRPWNIYSLRFELKNNRPEQVFKIEEENGWHKIIGSIDATYQSQNSGMIDTGYGTAYFNKNLSFNTFRKIKITQKTGINGYYITSEKDLNNKYGVYANKLIKDKTNNRFIFEKTTAPTIKKEATSTTEEATKINELQKQLKIKQEEFQNVPIYDRLKKSQLSREIINIQNQITALQKTSVSGDTIATTSQPVVAVSHPTQQRAIVMPRGGIRRTRVYRRPSGTRTGKQIYNFAGTLPTRRRAVPIQGRRGRSIYQPITRRPRR